MKEKLSNSNESCGQTAKRTNRLFMAVLTALVVCFVACERGGGEVTNDKEQALQQAVTPYVNNTVIATYSAMADAGMTLLNQCEQILAAQEAGQDYTTLMTQADASWRLMRKYWEQSEAFLYGPASTHNIDPHIDSWPLDFNAMNALLNNASQMAQIEQEGGAYVGDKLGYALKGFHACEYEITSVQYGMGGVNAANGLADSGLHWVTNHRIQLMTKYNF